MRTVQVRSGKRTEAVDITSVIQQEVASRKLDSGVCLVFSAHTTAGITVNEHADPAVMEDVLGWLGKRVPYEDNYRHQEGNSAAHIKTMLVGSSAMLPVEKGALALGRWQGIFLCEFDGPRERKVYVQFLPE